MKVPYSTIREFTISEMSADAGRKKPTRDFHVIRTEEFADRQHMSRPSRSNHFTIALIIDGECRLNSNLIQYSLRKNSLFIVPPGAVRQVQERTDNLRGLILEFTKEFLIASEFHKKHIDAFTFFSSRGNPHLILQNSEAEILKAMMLFLLQKELEEDHPFRKEVLHHGFNLFMFELAASFKKHRGNEKVKLTRKEAHLFSFVKLLNLHFKEERHVQYYADSLYITPKHLTKTVKELTNKTCGEFIDEMVITEAKILLDDPDMSIGNVSDALHFSDQFFFSKFFKNHTGVNPSEYKRDSKLNLTLLHR
jgi:AraC family transcriptional regulator, transcriptional activator of pobA